MRRRFGFRMLMACVCVRALLACWKQPCRHPLRAETINPLRTRRCKRSSFHACVDVCQRSSALASIGACVLPRLPARVSLGTELRACAHSSMRACVVASRMRVRRSHVVVYMRGITDECVRMQVCARRSACDRMHSRACLYVSVYVRVCAFVQFVSMLV